MIDLGRATVLVTGASRGGIGEAGPAPALLQHDTGGERALLARWNRYPQEAREPGR